MLQSLQSVIDRTSATQNVYSTENIITTSPQILQNLVKSALQLKTVSKDSYDQSNLNKLITDAQNYIVMYTNIMLV